MLTHEEIFTSIRQKQLIYSGYTHEVEAFHLYGDVAVLMDDETRIPNTGLEAGTWLYRRYTDIWQPTNGACQTLIAEMLKMDVQVSELLR